MFASNRPRLHRILIALVLCAPVGVSSLAARTSETGTTGFMAADEEMVQKLLRVRTREELVTELDSARRRLKGAQDDVAEMEGIDSVVTARVDVKKQEIELLKQRARLANKEADASQATQLEAQRRQEERQLDLFEAMRDAASTQVDRARAAREFAQARIDLQEAELDLVERREARIARATAPADATRETDLAEIDQRIRKSSRKVITSIRDYARRSERLAKATESLARSNLRLLDLWEQYGAK